jgi:hypothetical protein
VGPSVSCAWFHLGSVCGSRPGAIGGAGYGCLAHSHPTTLRR